jgi:cytochrome P450
LACLEAQIAIGNVVRTFSRIELAGSARRREHFDLRGLESLPAAVQAG